MTKDDMRKYFTWQEFDKSVEYIANKCKNLEFAGIYGIPRGGLCLAVALSHKLKVKLISEPINNSLIVDDVYETGFTLNPLRKVEGAMFFVLVSKKEPTWWNAVNISQKKEWIIFPWENSENTLYDKKKYLDNRRLS